MNNWYVVYRCKPLSGTVEDNLSSAGVEYFIPTIVTRQLNKDKDALVEKEVQPIKNLIFVRSDGDIREIVNAIDGLRCPMIDHATGRPAVIADTEMQNFMRFVSFKALEARILPDPFQRFKVCQKVRVSAGDFEGVTGYVFRIRGDRKLVISLGDMAVAISGIHHSLFDPID